MRMPKSLLLCSFFLCLFSLSLTAQSIKITDAAGKVTVVTAEQIAKLPHVTVEVKDHDTPAKFEGVPVSAVLGLAGISLGEKMRGARLADGILITAADAYKVLFALAELDPAFATREIILADKRDGKVLDSKEGPFRVVAPGDKRAGRWIRQVTEMKVVAAGGS